MAGRDNRTAETTDHGCPVFRDCGEHFRQIDARLADIQAGIAEIRAIYSSHHSRLERIERTLFGNGMTGLCTRVSAILWIVSGVAGFVILLVAQTIAAMLR